MQKQRANNNAAFPGDWEIRKVGEVCLVGTGGTPSTNRSEYYEPATINWVKSGDVKGTYIKVAEHRISDAGMKNSAATPYQPGTVMIALSGRGKTRGTTAILKIEAACSQSVAAMVPGSDVCPEFLHFQLLKRYPEIRSITGNDDRSGLNMSLIRDIDLIVPPLKEQLKIATVLGLVQRTIEQQEELIALTTELKKSLMNKCFSEGLSNEQQKQTELGPLPKSWEVVSLGSAVDTIDYGISAPIPKIPPPEGVKIVSTADITKDGRILYHQIRRIKGPEKTMVRLTLRTGDMLFNWRNSAELIGKSAVYDEQPDRHIFASFILRIRCGEQRSHNHFLTYLMNHWREEGVFVKLARRAVNQANYNRNEISALKIPLPRYEEQREIANAIGTVDFKLSLYRRKQTILSDLLRTLLHQLMNAQLRVHDLDLSFLKSEIVGS